MNNVINLADYLSKPTLNVRPWMKEKLFWTQKYNEAANLAEKYAAQYEITNSKRDGRMWMDWHLVSLQIAEKLDSMGGWL